MPENGIFSGVPFCLRSLGRLAKCVDSSEFQKIVRMYSRPASSIRQEPIDSKLGKKTLGSTDLRLTALQ